MAKNHQHRQFLPLAGNFKICKSSAGNAAGNAVGNVAGKYSFLKPILNRFSHMTHQIEV